MFFRLRRRGPVTEVAITDVVAPGGDGARMTSRLGREVLEASSGDYAIVVGPTRPRRWLRLRRIGPLLTWRPLADEAAPPLGQWGMSAGDVELF
jgi:hypothetical protein